MQFNNLAQHTFLKQTDLCKASIFKCGKRVAAFLKKLGNGKESVIQKSRKH